MSDLEPDFSPSLERLAGSDSAGLPAPNQGEPELVVEADVAGAAAAAAERVAAALMAAVERRGRADFCTTGGSITIPLYRLLASTPICDDLPWSQIHLWWGDDRYVPRGHPESNVTALDAVLLGGAPGERGSAPLPSTNIHPYPTDRAIAEFRDNSWCARRYAEEMAAHLPIGDGNWPVFDLILVGVGDDGHVLSVFPGSPALDRMEWTMGVPAPSHIGPHLPRMTVNPRLLEASPVLAVTWGERKAEALGHVFGDMRDSRRWPVQRTRRTGAVWIVDEAAAANIPAERRG
jgi:6-phosphogluconolactonase